MHRRNLIRGMALSMFSSDIIFANGRVTPKLLRQPDQAASRSNEMLWYRYPAKYWNSQALHIGNGFMGLSFWGGVEEERFDITEKSMWTGGPGETAGYHYGIKPGGKDHLEEIRQLITSNTADNIQKADKLVEGHFMGDYNGFGSFSGFGRLSLHFDHGSDAYSDYERRLDIARAIGSVSYEADGVRYHREYFCSYPGRVMVMKLSSNQKNKISFETAWNVLQKNHSIRIDHDLMHLSGKINGNNRNFSLKVKILPEGGVLSAKGENLVVRLADSVVIIIAAATEYLPVPPLYGGADADLLTATPIDRASKKMFGQMLTAHVEDYQRLYNRVKLTIPGNNEAESKPTDQRWSGYKNKPGADPAFKVLYFNLGRYLTISSSRSGSLPANIQGGWNMFETAPWNGNYQSNINLQLIYSGACLTNLLECHTPYVDWIHGLVAPGKETAEAYYGTSGWVSHSVGNVWGYTAPGVALSWGVYPAGAAWHCHAIWRHFIFSRDMKYLGETAYPVMKEAAVFWLANLVEYQGALISCPGVSAEHGAGIAGSKLLARGNSDGPALYNVPGNFQDVEIVYDLFTNTAAAARELDIDPDFVIQVEAARAKLMPLKIGGYGQLQEWCEDIDNPECNHRHISHLYAVWPSDQVSPYKNPELAEAAKKALNLRGESMCIPCAPDRDAYAAGNWSRAVRIWCWIRLLDGERANKIFTELITEEGFENLLTFQHTPRDSSAPRPEEQEVEEKINMMWQVDASMAIPGFIAEMLLQFHEGVLYLLPALPAEWESGDVKGLRAPGDLTVDMEWKNGKLLNYSVTSCCYKEINLNANGRIEKIKVNARPAQL